MFLAEATPGDNYVGSVQYEEIYRGWLATSSWDCNLLIHT